MNAVLLAPTKATPAQVSAPRYAFFDASQAMGLAVALWREPQHGTRSAEAQGVVAFGETRCGGGIDFTQGTPGFAFAPFSESGDSYFFRDDVRLAAGQLVVHPRVASTAGAFLREYAARLEGAVPPSAKWHTSAEEAGERAFSQGEFEALVRDAITFIERERIAKVVVSRMAPVSLPADFHPVALFDALCQLYPHAFVSLVSAPGAGTWLGATPELLLGLDEESLTTVALAGTQKRNGLPLEEIVWGRKERVEQEMVSAYVRGFFTGAGVQGLVEQGPQTVAAGGVVHLQTRFRVAADKAARLRLANRILADLHPTSAVCGMPRGAALSFIQAREGYNRAFYSGYLGPVHVDGRSCLYVNLRCLQVRAPHANGDSPAASLYVGAGITAESDPAAEWRETEMKAHTILDALNLPHIGALRSS